MDSHTQPWPFTATPNASRQNRSTPTHRPAHIAKQETYFRLSVACTGVTTTMRSPDGSRVYHSHSPPAAA